jgi:hypothetical protein
MRKLTVIAVMVGMIWISGIASAASRSTHSCSNYDAQNTNIKVTNTTCEVPKAKVIYYTSQGLNPPHWHCTAKKVSASKTDAKCTHAGNEKVTWVFHSNG